MKQAFEHFPFNLDEFVTVDEVGDEAEDRNSPSLGHSKLNLSEDNPKSPITSTPERKSSSDTSSEKFKKPPTVATPETRPSADTEADHQQVSDMMDKEPLNCLPVTEKKEAAKQKGDAVTTVVLQEASHQTVIGEIEKEETLTSEPQEPEEKAKESVAQTDSKEASRISEETSDNRASNVHDPNQFDSSITLVLKDELPQVSEPKEPESHAEHQSEKSDTTRQEMETKELPSQDALVTLDEVGGEDGDFADEADEEELLKRQAGENPEALLTVDEVGADEAEIEEEQLEKALQGLVTLDEIIEEEDGDDAGPFNPEVSIFTLLSHSWFGNISVP